MKRIGILFGIIICITTISTYGQSTQGEEEAVRDVILSSYIEGVFNKGDVGLIREGWYPGCTIYVLNEPGDTCLAMPAYSYVSRFEKNPVGLAPGTTAKIPLIHITDYAAIAVVDIFRENKHIYTDYINLYKFSDGWKIVTKTYYTWPKDALVFPDTPAGDRGKEMLELLNKKLDLSPKEYIRENCNNQFKDAIPESGWDGPIVMTQDMAGKVKLVSVEKSEKYEITYLIQSIERGMKFRIGVRTEEKEPYLISFIRFEPAG